MALPQVRAKDNNSFCRPAELESLEQSASFEMLVPRHSSVKELSGISVCCKCVREIVLEVGTDKTIQGAQSGVLL